MKKNSIVLSIIAVAFFAPAAAGALARAPFPNGKHLQPIPQYVAPNVSGNVNSSVQASYSAPQQTAGDTAPSEASNTLNTPDSQPNSTATNGVSVWIFLAAILFVFVLATVWLLR